MITKEHKMENISVAYVKTVVSKVGMAFGSPENDYGTDMEIKRVELYDNQPIDIGTACHLQLKATTNWQEKNDKIIYNMKVDAYNKLVIQNSSGLGKHYLVLFCMPKEEDQWIEQNHQCLTIRNCCYWCLIDGQKANQKSAITIKIPKMNIFDENAVKTIAGSGM